jgi:hypothetical protein
MRGLRIQYSADEMAWLEANRAMIISDYHREFVAKFGRVEVSALNLHGLRKRKGWFVGRKPGRFFGRHRKFSAAEMEWLKANATMVIGEYCAAFCDQFQREDVEPQNLHALRKRMGWKTGRTGCFAKGQEPPNKGMRCPEGVGGRHPNARKTQFKKGQLPHNHHGAGHERVDSKDGYAIIIVDEVNPWTGAATRPMHKHRWLWEQVNGPIPDGYVLKCLDGNKMNCDPSNWEAIPRGVLPRLNGGRATRVMAYDTAPDELKPVLMTIARVEQKASELRPKRRGGAA